MNKYKLLIIICFLILTFHLPIATAKVGELNLLGKVFVLDAGHGGSDSGAKSGQIIEKELNLILVKKLEKELTTRGAVVYLTREEDNDLSIKAKYRKRSDLYNRAKYINTIKPDMYISIHLNSTTTKAWKGLEVFYTNKNIKNKEIANQITNDLKKNIKNVREIKEDNTYYMYKHIKYPGVLIEAGFISNPDENYLLRQEEYQNKLITLLADSIEKYYQK